VSALLAQPSTSEPHVAAGTVAAPPAFVQLLAVALTGVEISALRTPLTDTAAQDVVMEELSIFVRQMLSW
jgi:hypothetical protein